MSNPTLRLSRFVSAQNYDTPQDVCEAVVWNEDPDGYDMLTVLNTYAEHQTESGCKDYFSFSRWIGGHDEGSHDGTTALTLEYKADREEAVRAKLLEYGFCFYEVQTRSGRTDCALFAVPIDDDVDHTDTTRAASILADAIGIDGLTANSFLYTWFFRFKHGYAVQFTDGTPFERKLIRQANDVGFYTEIKRFFR